MKRLSNCIAICLLAAYCSGCNKTSPTHFWYAYHPELITQKHDDTGSRGGWSYIHWASTNPGTFDVQTVMKFATNKWTFVSQQSVSKDAVAKWVRDGRAIFPLGYNGFAPEVDDSAYEHFPRWITEDATLMKFDSGWITAMAGNTKTAYAYVLVTSDGKQMALYHLWGE